MPATIKNVRAALDPEEPDYDKAARLGPDAIPHLETLVEKGDPMIASKAAYLASLIPSEASVGVLKKAAKRPEASVRVTVAAAADNLSEGRSVVAGLLLNDPDAGVRRIAVRTIMRHATELVADLTTSLWDVLRHMAESDPDPVVRKEASQAARHATGRTKVH
jgi:HEAT repeat protein